MLAIQLGLPWKKIEEIKKAHKDTFEQCVAMFVKWKDTTRHYTWSALIDALKLVDEEPLANRLHKKHCT